MLAPLLITMATLTPSALAYEIKLNSEGHELHWEQAEVVYEVNPLGAHGLDEDIVLHETQASAQAWADVSGVQLDLVQYENDSMRVKDLHDGVNLVFFDDEWAESSTLLAVTYLWSIEGGELTDFDIAINSRDHDWGSEGDTHDNDLRNALTLEFGHAMGLDHAEGNDEATMAPSTTAGEVRKRDLAPDDIAAMRSLYAHDDLYRPPAGCSVGALPLSALTSTVWLPFFLITRRRKKTPPSEAWGPLRLRQ